MRLSQLIQTPLDTDVVITGVCSDSRHALPGYVFLAYQGTKTDGKRYIPAALQNGANVVIADDYCSNNGRHHVMTVVDQQLRDNAAHIAQRFYAMPDHQLDLVAVTGTNGKTSIVTIVTQMLEHIGVAAGCIATTGWGAKKKWFSSSLTTPDAPTLYRSLAWFVANNTHTVCFELSSHALEQQRFAKNSCIHTAVFTNLSRDHLDYHQSMHQYAAAKSQLFIQYACRNAVIYRDDRYSQQMIDAFYRHQTGKLISYGCSNSADFWADNIEFHPTSITFNLHYHAAQQRCTTSLIGKHSVENLLAAAAILTSLGYDFVTIATVLQQPLTIAGRMQRVGTAPYVYVDYAHTPAALTTALQALRHHGHNTIFVVFGCGGDRDRGKRAMMGAAACRDADMVVITSDNPRSESPISIIDDIQRGMIGSNTPTKILIDRGAAIRYAISHAQATDAILIAGKGHEKTQIIGATSSDFNDVCVAQQVMNNAAK